MNHPVSYTLIFAILIMIACSPSRPQATSPAADHQQEFWAQLSRLCGKSFAGTVAASGATDTMFQGKELIMHVRSCGRDRIRVPFYVGEDASRTWVFTRGANNIELKHDHRHRDGTEDAVTQYGGTTANKGTPVLQMFPADAFTAAMLPAAALNVWWVELVPGSHFSYNLRRMGTDRLFSVRFDITREVAEPPAPWGWGD